MGETLRYGWQLLEVRLLYAKRSLYDNNYSELQRMEQVRPKLVEYEGGSISGKWNA